MINQMNNQKNNENIIRHCTGVLIQIKGCKKYGFIRLLDNMPINANYQIDAFTPIDDISHEGIKKVREGMLVEYDLKVTNKGYDAENVKVIESL